MRGRAGPAASASPGAQVGEAIGRLSGLRVPGPPPRAAPPAPGRAGRPCRQDTARRRRPRCPEPAGSPGRRPPARRRLSPTCRPGRGGAGPGRAAGPHPPQQPRVGPGPRGGWRLGRLPRFLFLLLLFLFLLPLLRLLPLGGGARAQPCVSACPPGLCPCAPLCAGRAAAPRPALRGRRPRTRLRARARVSAPTPSRVSARPRAGAGARFVPRVCVCSVRGRRRASLPHARFCHAAAGCARLACVLRACRPAGTPALVAPRVPLLVFTAFHAGARAVSVCLSGSACAVRWAVVLPWACRHRVRGVSLVLHASLLRGGRCVWA